MAERKLKKPFEEEEYSELMPNKNYIPNKTNSQIKNLKYQQESFISEYTRLKKRDNIFQFVGNQDSLIHKKSPKYSEKQLEKNNLPL